MEIIQSLLHTQHPVIVGIVLFLIIGFIISLVRSLVKLAVTIVIVGLIAVLVFGVKPNDFIQSSVETTKLATSAVHNTVISLMDKELNNAKVEKKDNGDYIIRTANLIIKGTNNNDLTVSYKDHEYDVDFNDLSKGLQDKINSLKNT